MNQIKSEAILRAANKKFFRCFNNSLEQIKRTATNLSDWSYAAVKPWMASNKLPPRFFKMPTTVLVRPLLYAGIF